MLEVGGVGPYPRAMDRRSGGLFAGRGIALPPLRITLIAVIAAFGLGIGTGWLTGYVPDLYRDWQAGPVPSASPSPTLTAEPEVSLSPLAPITRELDEADADAGVLLTNVVERGEGTFTSVPVPDSATGTTDDGGPVRFVRVDVEDGVRVDEEALAAFVMETLNDHRGWGSAGRMQFVLTDGAADVRVTLASPYTVATLCPNPHEAAVLAVDGASSASPSAAADDDAEPNCATLGAAPISSYDWTAGLDAFGDKRTQARRYLINHMVGHVLGEEDTECIEGRAEITVDQQAMPGACRTNPWPFPDAEQPAGDGTGDDAQG